MSKGFTNGEHMLVWHKLELLKSGCNVEIRSLFAAGTLSWQVTIGRDHPPIVVEREELRDAVTAAIEQAEARGWLPKP